MSRETEASMVAEAKSRVESLTPVEVAAALDGETLLVDVREPEEQIEQGAIPDSIAAPRGMLEFWADRASPLHRSEFDPERRVILYCATGERSALAADLLQRLGFSLVAHLDGGFQAWKEDGRPVDLT